MHGKSERNPFPWYCCSLCRLIQTVIPMSTYYIEEIYSSEDCNLERTYIDWSSSSMKHYICLCTMHTWPLIYSIHHSSKRNFILLNQKILIQASQKWSHERKEPGLALQIGRDFIVHSCSFYRFVWKSKPCWFHNGEWSVSHIWTFLCV